MPDHTSENACREVFRRWLEGGDELLSPKDWTTVITVMKRIEQTALADEILKILEGRGHRCHEN